MAVLEISTRDKIYDLQIDQNKKTYTLNIVTRNKTYNLPVDATKDSTLTITWSDGHMDKYTIPKTYNEPSNPWSDWRDNDSDGGTKIGSKVTYDAGHTYWYWYSALKCNRDCPFDTGATIDGGDGYEYQMGTPYSTGSHSSRAPIRNRKLTKRKISE